MGSPGIGVGDVESATCAMSGSILDAKSLQVVLDDVGWTGRRVVGILPGMSACLTLPQQIPALIEVHLECAQTRIPFTFADISAPESLAQLVLLPDQLGDVVSDGPVGIRKVVGHAPTLRVGHIRRRNGFDRSVRGLVRLDDLGRDTATITDVVTVDPRPVAHGLQIA